jgi:cysteine desulfurase
MASGAYLDHAATSPLRPEAREAMLPFLGERFGNPSGSHSVARSARSAVDETREVVAAALGADPSEIIFTGGGTEADNLAVLGAQRAIEGTAVCSAIEHDAVLESARTVPHRLVGVGENGVIDLDALAGALDEGVAVVSVMLANNEVGTIQPLDEVATLMRRRAPRAVLHTDAVQAICWLDVAELARRADLVSISAHKFGGPQGVGVLVVRGNKALTPVIHGGGQERGRRSGTHNVAGIVGLGAALSATVADRSAAVARVAALRDRLADGLLSSVEGCIENGDRQLKVAGNCHVRFEGVESEELLFLLDGSGVYASAGSACASGATEPSHVLSAMGLTAEQARSAVRLSLGWSSTGADVDAALAEVPAAVDRLRQATVGAGL